MIRKLSLLFAGALMGASAMSLVYGAPALQPMRQAPIPTASSRFSATFSSACAPNM
jgi:hypothetical protein